MDRLEAYLVRRVKKLLAGGWTKHDIVQQLAALDSKRKIEQLIDKVSTV